MRVVLDVDTGTDDTGALWLAATHPALELVAVTATWGNTNGPQVVRNTLAIMHACARSDVPVYTGASQPIGAAPTRAPAETVMKSDGIGDVGVVPPLGAAPVAGETGAAAIARLAGEHPGELTLVAVAPLSTVAGALTIRPDLPKLLAGLVVMGGAIAVSGNSTAAAEANIAHDPLAAAAVAEAFGRAPYRPRLVPLDATLAAPLTGDERDAVAGSSLPGAATVHRIWSSVWPTGALETGVEGVWPCHDLLAIWSLIDPDCLVWRNVALTVDTGGSAAWGATVADRRPWAEQRRQTDVTWSVALEVDGERHRAGVREWLASGGRQWETCASSGA